MTPAAQPVNPEAAAFVNDRVGFVGGASCVAYRCGSGAIALTTDGGRTFRVVVRTRSPVQSLRVTSGGVVARLRDATALRTVDGGRSWHRFTEHEPGYGARCRGYASSVADAVTPRLVWLLCVGEGSAGSQAKALFRSGDGGRTWQHAGPVSGAGYAAGISFAPGGFGLLWEQRGTLYVTQDGGSHWTPEPALAAPDVDFGRGGSAFADGHGFVLLGRGGCADARLLATADAGRTWRVVHRWHRSAPAFGCP